ncbi:HD domain-containing protein [Leptolyngbya cf. ectocarpi LEGE 11479]|uniref:HD domain-containing protein n=1 Tax=Leptolyngbya cf. ectocarpi LEGE 11479 TaxID=1828722 RepID=A0A928X3C4_LEPEC|nr:HD domain-containing protein [Leptolyngbya ectocarpi]MBE9065783.1 HD domain-containing protein [Leptolyngbya cf. ectocarpi LEGE 11479]
MVLKTRTYHDPLHGAITLDRADPVEALLVELIDTSVFQRLRRIRQLGPASLTFHGAESSRFTHSLGVMAIARRAFDRLAAIYPELGDYRAAVLCAALLHDIGHGPFSHTAEEVFGSHHEHWTAQILELSAEVRGLLDGFSADLRPEIHQIYQHQHPVPCVWQLVSSQLDCDRIDYLMRDSYFTGASYGQLDLDRIILALDYDPASQQLIVAKKGLGAIEHYLVVRYFMYAQIYNHPKNLVATWVLEKAINQAKKLLSAGSLKADATMAAWLTHAVDELPLDRYLAQDDYVLHYHLQQWQTHSDPILADLCQRFVNRQLLKATDISHYPYLRQMEILSAAQCQAYGLVADTDIYVGLRHIRNRGYALYQQGIKLKTPDGLTEISQLSPLVQTLIQPCHRTWLIHPAELPVAEIL